MATYIIYADANDQRVVCSSTTYANARSGTGTLTLESSAATMEVGQHKITTTNYCYQYFMSFDTSAVPADTPTTNVTLKVNVFDNGASKPFKVSERAWSSGTGAFVPGADLNALTVFGSITISSTGVKTITGPADVARSSAYKLMMWGQEQYDNIAPVGAERSQVYSGNHANAPYLTIIVPYTGTASLTEAADTLTATGTMDVTGAAGLTEAADTIVATGENLAIGEAAMTEAADTIDAEASALVPVFTPQSRTLIFETSQLSGRTLTLQ